MVFPAEISNYFGILQKFDVRDAQFLGYFFEVKFPICSGKKMRMHPQVSSLAWSENPHLGVKTKPKRT